MNYHISDNQCERCGGFLDEMNTKSHYLATTEDEAPRIICKVCSDALPLDEEGCQIIPSIEPLIDKLKTRPTDKEIYYAVTPENLDQAIFGVGRTKREAWEEAREWAGDDYIVEEGDVDPMEEMEIFHCSKALYDEVNKNGGQVLYELDKQSGMLVLAEEMPDFEPDHTDIRLFRG